MRRQSILNFNPKDERWKRNVRNGTTKSRTPSSVPTSQFSADKARKPTATPSTVPRPHSLTLMIVDLCDNDFDVDSETYRKITSAGLAHAVIRVQESTSSSSDRDSLKRSDRTFQFLLEGIHTSETSACCWFERVWMEGTCIDVRDGEWWKVRDVDGVFTVSLKRSGRVSSYGVERPVKVGDYVGILGRIRKSTSTNEIYIVPSSFWISLTPNAEELFTKDVSIQWGSTS